MSKPSNIVNRSKIGEVDSFLDRLASFHNPSQKRPAGRLMIALDATASRQATWDRAAHLQAEMFQVASSLGGLDIQLAFFRGFGEFKVSQWTNNTDELSRLMTSVTCLAGETQLLKVLKHARNEVKKSKIDALVYIGDSFEEDVDVVGQVAGELGILGLPCFMFQEGGDPLTTFAYEQIARLSAGAFQRFDASSAGTLLRLLKAVAVFASGGKRALCDHADQTGGEVKLVVDQMFGKRSN
ncbi:MAG: hypothetical protein CBB68_03570 [Rhodospirillaceae bacterium TMED8]|nr:MAG: hypothetical protein CBB68_03570 [Rhodospirillaceae bacterium TMED8]